MKHDSTNPSRHQPFDIDRALLVQIGLAALLAISILWGMTLRGDRDRAQDQAASLEAEVATLREGANATAYQLLPAADAPANAGGTAFFALDGTGVMSVVNLEPAPEGRSYQVWYYPTPESTPLPGATFSLDENGTGFMLIPADVGVFTIISVTLEPEAGTTAPSGPLILEGTTGGARG
ncbi:MAG: anti-sigma factor [Chloroflexota bacterium]|nr:anti-sigma factor [Chloroflexota bacterium]